MSSQNSQHSTLSFFEDIFFGDETSAPNEQQQNNLIQSEPEKKGYNTRGKVKALEHNEPGNNTEQSQENELEKNKPQTPAFGSLDSLFDDIAPFDEENFKPTEFHFDSFMDGDDVQSPESPLANVQTTLLKVPSDLGPTTEMEKEGDDLTPVINVPVSNQQESSEPKEPANSTNHVNNSSSNSNSTIQPKRHSLRKRNEIQLHPYSLEKAKYMSIVGRQSRSRTSRDRMQEYIDVSQYTQEQDNDDDPDFVPGQPNIPTQSDSIVQETQESELDSNVLVLPKRRSKPASSLSRTSNSNITNNTTRSITNTSRNKKSVVESLLNEKECISSHYLQTDPISSLPPSMNTKGKHRIIHTFKRKKHSKPSNNSAVHRNVFDFDPEPRASYNPDDEDEVESSTNTNQDKRIQVSDEEEEEISHLPKKWPKKRKVIISDSDDDVEDKESDDNDDDNDVVTYSRRKGDRRSEQKRSLLEPNSVTLFEEMVNDASQAQQEQPRRTYRRQRPDDDVVPVVQDENELGMRENRRVRLNDITSNNRMLRGILPYSFANAYRSELQEEQQWNQTRRNNKNPTKRRRVEKEKQPEIVKLHTPTNIFSDEEDDDENSENAPSQTQQNHLISSVYTQSKNSDQSLEAIEDNRMAKHFIRETNANTQTRFKSRRKATSRSSTAIGHNKVTNYYQKSSSSRQISQKRRRRKIRKTTDDLYIRPSRHYWNDETIDRMFIRQGWQAQRPRQKMASQDDIFIGQSSFRPTTTSHKTKVTWIHNIEDYLRSEQIEHTNSNRSIRELREREERRLSTARQNRHHQQQPQQQQHRQQKETQNITVASVLERVGDLVDADLRTTVGLSNTVYLHHRLLPSLLSGARNKKKYFLRFKSLLQHPIIHNTRVSWQDIVPTQQKLIRGWFWKAFYNITTTFQAQELSTIDPTFYIFISVCIGRWIPSLPGDIQMAMIKIFNNETRIFVSQICQFITQNMASSPFIPWRVVIEAMLFTLDWKCRLFNLGADEAIWPLTDLTSSLIQLLVEIGPERLTMVSTSYVSEAWICLLQIMSISTDSDGYRFDEHLFLSQLEKWVDVKASKETWSKSYKSQAMNQWATAFKYVFDNYML